VTAAVPDAPSPYDAPELYDLLFDGLAFDIPFWLATGRAAQGAVLDVGCGTGRVLLRLLEAGVDADGIDRSAPMLEQLRARAAARSLEVRAYEGDMRDFTLPRRYTRAICAFNAFAHCDSTDDQLRALRCIREHLEPGGALVLHMSYPTASLWLGPDGEPVFEIASKHPLNDHTLEVWDTRFKDIVNQHQRSEVEIRELDASGRLVDSQRFETTQRWVYRYELELLLMLAGFARSEIFGGFDGEPLDDQNSQMVVWAWRE